MTDPVTPPVLIVEPTRGFRIWRTDEIYTTADNPGRYVPNVGDGVWDWMQGMFKVTAVDYTTGESTIAKWNPPADPNVNSNEDILLGAGPGTQSESYRAYLDDSVVPHTLALDSRLHIYGTTAKNIKIFRGTNISETTGEVISAFYDQNGSLLGENIPLELVVMPGITNVAVKTPMVGYTMQSLPDGEVVTAVVYDDAGGVVSIAKLLIKNTAFVRTTDASMKYITGISVDTPFLSDTDPKRIEYPINMPIDGLNLMGVVTYSDGSQLRMPIDGTKFSLYGLNAYIATIQGQEVPLVLSYLLSPGEFSYILTPSPDKHISVPYRAVTLQADGAYSIKIFAYPVWIDALNGYRLEYFLYNLDRQAVYRVTNLIQMASGSAAFNPIVFGATQKIVVAVDLNRVDSRFAAYRHVQTLEITLLANGDEHNLENWTVGFSPGQTPPYGAGVKAIAQFVNTNNWKLDLTSGCGTLEQWLEKVFYATQPLYDPMSEEKAPAPNFFKITSGNYSAELPIASWNSEITVGAAPIDGGCVFLEFFRRDPSTDLQLGVSGMIVHYADSP